MIQKRAVKLKLGHNYSTYDDTQLKLTKQLNLNSLDSRRHELTYHFGLNCLNSPANRGLLPDLESHSTEGIVTRPRLIKNNSIQLMTYPASCTGKYCKSFVPYFIGYFNNIPLTNI